MAGKPNTHKKTTRGENIMKKAKYNEVPKEYRRNYKREAMEIFITIAICTAGVVLVGLAFVFF